MLQSSIVRPERRNGTQRQPSRSPNPDRPAIISSEPPPKRRVSSGFARVMGWPAGSTGFCWVVAPAGLLTNPDWSSHRVGPVPGRPAGQYSWKKYSWKAPKSKNNLNPNHVLIPREYCSFFVFRCFLKNTFALKKISN